LRDFRFPDNADDIRGTKLYGRNDEKLGEIADVIFNHQTGDLRYVVVDAGGWLSSKRFLVPADRIRPHDEKDVYAADLSKREIERFPAYDEDHLKDEEKWSRYEKDYRAASGFEETGGVLHQAGGTNILVRDDLPAGGKAPVRRSGQPVTGYKSPTHHQEVGMMDTTPLGVGHNQDDERLTFVPDAIGAGRGDIHDKDMPEVVSSPPRQVGEAADVARASRSRDIANRETDTTYHTDRGSKLSEVEETIEGDAIFNSEDIRGRTHQRGNVRDSDTPSYATVGGEGTSTTAGRTLNYPDAGQGQRWARFEENLRRQRPTIVGRCSVCEEFQNRHTEDAA
jgi:hypothetical protein